MQVFTSEELQRQPADVQQSALVEPAFITFHGKPRLVIMSVDEFDRMRNRQRSVLNSVDIPDEVTAGLQEIAARHPVSIDELGLIGGLLDDDTGQTTGSSGMSPR
ncbi:MAG: type II toxin-antitoxin system Phd/YefM family antitoxin [Azospirillum sp.]|nr:type II toxin-antitoxin system Phd/YefM family antitoxin [Azospirillum sp.]